jgi:hypothetical protein
VEKTEDRKVIEQMFAFKYVGCKILNDINMDLRRKQQNIIH